MLNHILLERLLSELTDEEKRLIALRYFQDKTQVEVARRLGISQVQVSRLEKGYSFECVDLPTEGKTDRMKFNK